MIKIEKAKLKDAQPVRKLEEATWKEGVTAPYDAATFVEYGYTFVAKEKGKIVGAIIAIKTTQNEIRVLDWVVDIKHRRKGIGEKLYLKLLQKTKNAPLTAYVNAKNKSSIKGHEKLGFKVVKKVNDPYGQNVQEPAFVFRKE